MVIHHQTYESAYLAYKIINKKYIQNDIQHLLQIKIINLKDQEIQNLYQIKSIFHILKLLS